MQTSDAPRREKADVYLKLADVYLRLADVYLRLAIEKLKSTFCTTSDARPGCCAARRSCGVMRC
jgi:hypothetical protein